MTDHTKYSRDELAQIMYKRCTIVAPAWSQLGAVTKEVWREKADRFLAGDAFWFYWPTPEPPEQEPEIQRRPARRRLLID